MSITKTPSTDIHVSASESESEKYISASSSQQCLINSETQHAKHSSDETSGIDHEKTNGTLGVSSEKDATQPKTPESKSTSSLSPTVTLISTSGSATSLNVSRESVEKEPDISSVDCGPSSLGSVTPDNISQFPDNLSRSSESGKSIDLGHQKTPLRFDVKDEKAKGGAGRERKKPSWYSNMLNPTYKTKSEDFKRLFKDLPPTERLIVDYSCALQKEILVQGRLYASQNYVCFYANIFRWETHLSIRCRDVTGMTKEKTARVIPNAIQVCTENEKYFFTSFGARDKTFVMLFRIWQNALMEQPMSSQELWAWVHRSYGNELGLTSDDDDYVAPGPEDEKGKRDSDHNIAKYFDKLYEKDSLVIPEMSNELYAVDDNSESASGIGNADGPIIECIDEDGEVKENSKSLPNPKNLDFPTDMSDSTESQDNGEAVELKCSCIEHAGKEVLNEVFPLSVDQVFQLIFTGSKFYNNLLESRKTYDIMESPWQLCPEFDLKMRQVAYTLTLNHSMAKSAQTTETQRLLKHSKSGQVYTVDCDVVNTGIPYSDAFNVKSVYCMTKVSKRESRLRISGCVHYKKSVWGLVKSLIEKSAMQGLADFASDLANALHKEAEVCSQLSAGKKGRRRKRMKFDPTAPTNSKDAPRILQRQPTVRNMGATVSGIDLVSLSSTPEIVIRVILATLVILLFLNMLLFCKLWSLEDQSSMQVTTPILDYIDPQSTLSKEDYIHLLQKQDALHRAETERWRDALSEVIKLIHLIEKSLSELKSNIDTYSSTSVLKAIALRMSQSQEMNQDDTEP